MLRFLIYGNCNDFLNILQDILLGKVKKYRLLYRKRLQNSTRTYCYVTKNKETNCYTNVSQKILKNPLKLKENSENIIRHN
ncbi:hypothetical protein BC30102_3073 [Bacillus cereus]|nr:hypothetical protein BC30102_3073 [Bacillus cereus]